jgi:hypothetical protein
MRSAEARAHAQSTGRRWSTSSNRAALITDPLLGPPSLGDENFPPTMAKSVRRRHHSGTNRGSSRRREPLAPPQMTAPAAAGSDGGGGVAGLEAGGGEVGGAKTDEPARALSNTEVLRAEEGLRQAVRDYKASDKGNRSVEPRAILLTLVRARIGPSRARALVPLFPLRNCGLAELPAEVFVPRVESVGWVGGGAPIRAARGSWNSRTRPVVLQPKRVCCVAASAPSPRRTAV